MHSIRWQTYQIPEIVITAGMVTPYHEPIVKVGNSIDVVRGNQK